MKQVRFLPQSKIIRATELGAITEAEKLFEVARSATADADAFRTAVAEEVRTNVESSMVAELQSRLSQEVSTAVRQLQLQLQPHSDELASIISDVSEQIWTEAPPDARIRGLVQKALDEYRDRQAVAICVCPAELDAMTRIVGEHVKSNSIPPVRVEVSANLKPGDIVLRTEKGHIEISFSRQIAEVRRALGL